MFSVILRCSGSQFDRSQLVRFLMIFWRVTVQNPSSFRIANGRTSWLRIPASLTGVGMPSCIIPLIPSQHPKLHSNYFTLKESSRNFYTHWFLAQQLKKYQPWIKNCGCKISFQLGVLPSIHPASLLVHCHLKMELSSWIFCDEKNTIPGRLCRQSYPMFPAMLNVLTHNKSTVWSARHHLLHQREVLRTPQQDRLRCSMRLRLLPNV